MPGFTDIVHKLIMETTACGFGEANLSSPSPSPDLTMNIELFIELRKLIPGSK